MFKLDGEFLRGVGLARLVDDPPAANRMLATVYSVLELRVGMRLAESMTNDQLDEFERFIDAKDDAGALSWLETNFPDYRQVVAQQLDEVRLELLANSDVIEMVIADARSDRDEPGQHHRRLGSPPVRRSLDKAPTSSMSPEIESTTGGLADEKATAQEG